MRTTAVLAAERVEQELTAYKNAALDAVKNAVPVWADNISALELVHAASFLYQRLLFFHWHIREAPYILSRKKRF